MGTSESFRRKIIKEFYFNPVLSCAELSRNINKSIPLTTKLLNECVEEGLIEETGYAPSTGGRRPVTYSLRSDVLYIVSVAMDQFLTRIALMDMQNNVVTRVETLELQLTKDAEALPALTEAINRTISQSGISTSKIAGVGIGMPGFVDVNKGVNYTFLEVPGRSLVASIEDAVGLPVFIDNDSSLIALAELRFGAARGKNTVMVINIGWGIGLGMLLNGNLYRGNNGLAGEFSHIPMFMNNRLCGCGKSGCLETETSLTVIAQKAVEGLEAGRLSMLKGLSTAHLEETVSAVLEAASKGDAFAIELLSEAGYNIGRGAAILIHLMNPELIVLSGIGSGAGRLWLAPIQHAINQHCIPKIAENTQVEISSLGYRAELMGAASLVMENYDVTNYKEYDNMQTT